MLLRKLLKGTLSLLCLVLPILFSPQARADSYKLYEAAVSSGSIDTLGISTDGTILMSFASNPDHWATFSPASSTYTDYNLIPAFAFDNGSACAPANLTAFTSVSQVRCNNGHLAVIASTDTIRQGVFDGTDPFTDLVYNGLSGGLLLNSMGDLAFYGYNAATPFGLADANFVAYDTTTHIAVTPEPSSLLLVATGLIGGIRSVRRRYRS